MTLYSNSTRYPVGNVFYKVPNIITDSKLSTDSDSLIAAVLNNMMPLNKQLLTKHDITISEEEDFRTHSNYYSPTIYYLSNNTLDESDSLALGTLAKGNL